VTGVRIADRWIEIAGDFSRLKPFETHPSQVRAEAPRDDQGSISPLTSTRAIGRIAGRDREVVCRFGEDQILVQVEGVARFLVAENGCRISPGIEESPTPLDDLTESILGPPLLLALAIQGIACLHAGAVATKGGVIAFLGRSGAGKSTLAEYLDRRVDDWDRCADDLLPLGPCDGCVDALLHFPQLQLENHQQWCPPRPGRLPLRAVYVLDEDPSSGSAITTESLPLNDAAATALEHSAAWTLFPPELMNRHLAFCGRIAETVPVRRLTYPRRLEVLPEVAAAIQADLERNV
jgi:hypothetical protein